jgi:membrane-associated phospholipid phosphatase
MPAAPAPLAATPRRAGLREIVPRVRTWFWLKTFGVTAVIWLFFIGYFHLLRHPRQEPFVMPLTALDAAVPFAPAALWIYLSLWFYVGIPPGLMLSLRELMRYGAWAGALCLAGLALFYLVPTAVPPPAVAIDVVQHRAFAVLQGVDAAGNACPSMHVASAVFTALWLWRLLGEIRAQHWLQVLNVVWVLLIVHSTVATRQHVVLDVVAGAALGAVFAALSLADRRRVQRRERLPMGVGR